MNRVPQKRVYHVKKLIHNTDVKFWGGVLKLASVTGRELKYERKPPWPVVSSSTITLSSNMYLAHKLTFVLKST